MQQDTAPCKQSEIVVTSGWNREGEYVETRDEVSDYEKPRWRGVLGLDGSLTGAEGKCVELQTES